MSFQPKYVCDICAKPKGAANHWFLGTVFFEQVAGPPGQPPLRGLSFYAFAPWKDSVAQQPQVQHFCSEECAHKKLARLMAPPPPPKAPDAPIDPAAIDAAPAKFCDTFDGSKI